MGRHCRADSGLRPANERRRYFVTTYLTGGRKDQPCIVNAMESAGNDARTSACRGMTEFGSRHDDVIKWKHFPRYWPFVRGIHRSPVNSPHKGQWRGALAFSLICARMNSWVNDREAGDLTRHCAHYDVTIMLNQVSKVKLNNYIPQYSVWSNYSSMPYIPETCI